MSSEVFRGSAGKPGRPIPDPARRGVGPSVTRGDGVRILGIDVARALAIFGMFAVHLNPTEPDGPLRHVFTVPHGRASLLFMLVAGVGTALLAGSTHPSIATVRLKLLWRSTLLLPLGLALQELDHNVAVILQSYAVLFVAGTVLITIPSRWLLRIVTVLVPAGSMLYLWGTVAAPDVFDSSPVGLSNSLLDVARGLLLTGPYPVITWLAPYVLGIWIGRLDLRASGVRLRLFGWGASVALAAYATNEALVAWLGEPSEQPGWDRLIVDTPHSQMPLWVIGSTAVAVSLLGAALLVVDRARRLSWPLAATGQLALTVYVGHLLALHWMSRLPSGPTMQSAVVVLSTFVLVAALASVVWRAIFRRGPLEVLLQAPWR